MFRIPQPPLVGRRRRLSRWRLPPSLSLNLPLALSVSLSPLSTSASRIGRMDLPNFPHSWKVWGKSVGQKCGAEVEWDDEAPQAKRSRAGLIRVKHERND